MKQVHTFVLTTLAFLFLWFCCGDYGYGKLFVMVISLATYLGLIVHDFYKLFFSIFHIFYYNKR